MRVPNLWLLEDLGWGPPMLTGKNEYETWYYHTETSIVRFWFSHPTASKEKWVVIGSTSTSKGGNEPL